MYSFHTVFYAHTEIEEVGSELPPTLKNGITLDIL